MQYKTMALGLLERHPRLHRHLREGRLLLRTADNLARELKAGHEAWTRRLARSCPPRGEIQAGSEGLELALWDVEDLLARLLAEGTEPAAFPAAIAERGRSRPA
jgi:hypothetical protein